MLVQAILTVEGNKVMVLTRCPGTRKTTTIGIILAHQAAWARILLAAPMGRADKRLSETDKQKTKNLHRLP